MDENEWGEGFPTITSLFTVSSEIIGVTILIRQFFRSAFSKCRDTKQGIVRYFLEIYVSFMSVYKLLKDDLSPAVKGLAV